jgi:adenosylhomocysteine nucleosidase
MEDERRAVPAGAAAIVSGPGFRLARRAAEQAIAQAPDLVVNLGTCGALRSEFPLGAVFSPRLREVETQQVPHLPGAILCSQDRVAVTKQEKAMLAAEGADLVDMEALPIAQVCQQHQVPFTALKAVSDLADEDLPLDFNLYRDPSGQFQTFRIALAGIFQVRDLLRLQKQSRLAIEKLGEAAANAF